MTSCAQSAIASGVISPSPVFVQKWGLVYGVFPKKSPFKVFFLRKKYGLNGKLKTEYSQQSRVERENDYWRIRDQNQRTFRSKFSTNQRSQALRNASVSWVSVSKSATNNGINQAQFPFSGASKKIIKKGEKRTIWHRCAQLGQFHILKVKEKGKSVEKINRNRQLPESRKVSRAI